MELAHFCIDIYLIGSKGSYFQRSTYHPPYQSEVELSYNFTSQGTPSSTQLTLHGITKEHADLFVQGATVKIRAGYYDSPGVENEINDVVNATIKSVEPYHNDNGDYTMTITLQDGTNYDTIKEIKVASSKLVRVKSTKSSRETASQRKEIEDKHRQIVKDYRAKHGSMPKAKMQAEMKRYRSELKQVRTEAGKQELATNEKTANKVAKQVKTVYKALAFKKNTKASAIIQKVAKSAGIDIAKMKLVRDKMYKNGYTANKKPMAVIREVAGECNTNVYYQHGNLMIQSFVQRKKLNLTISNETGLLQPPTYQTDADVDNTWEVNMAYRPQISTGSIFYLNHTALHGWVIAVNGSASFTTGDTPTLTVDVQLLSQYKQDEAKKVNEAKQKDLKADEKQKKVAKAKRSARQKAHSRK